MFYSFESTTARALKQGEPGTIKFNKQISSDMRRDCKEWFLRIFQVMRKSCVNGYINN